MREREQRVDLLFCEQVRQSALACALHTLEAIEWYGEAMAEEFEDSNVHE